MSNHFFTGGPSPLCGDRARRKPSPWSRPCGLGRLSKLPQTRSRGMVPPTPWQASLPTPLKHGKPLQACRKQPPCGRLPPVDGQCWHRASMGRSPRGVPNGQQVINHRIPILSPFMNLSLHGRFVNGLSRHKAARVVAMRPTRFLFHEPLTNRPCRLAVSWATAIGIR